MVPPQIEKPRSASGVVVDLAGDQAPAFQIIQIFAYGDTGESDPVSNQGTGDGLFIIAEKINDFFQGFGLQPFFQLIGGNLNRDILRLKSHKPVNIILTEGGICQDFYPAERDV